MVALDPAYLPSCSQASERNEAIIGQRYQVAVSIQEHWFFPFVRIQARHQKQRLHVHSAVEVKNLGQLLLDNTVKS